LNININLRDPDEARKAVALARELVSARVLAWKETGPDGSMPPVLSGALARAVMDVLEGEQDVKSLAERIGYVFAALALVGAVAVDVAGQGLELDGTAEEGEGTDHMLRLITQTLENREGKEAGL
jgi:hypothetical protein